MKANTFSQSDPLVSVVIRNRNEGFYLERVFAALQSQNVQFAYEIILVDNESEDNSCEVGMKNEARLITISREEFTYGRALNLGIAQARGKFILLLSAHALPIGSNFLQSCIVPFSDLQVAAARCLSTSDGQRLMQWYQPDVVQYSTTEEQERAETGKAWLRLYPTAACCILRRSVWEEIKIDETLEANEDKEWGSRVLAAGYKVINSAECVFHYMKPFDEITLWKKQQREFLALYRIKGYIPLTWKWFLIRMLQALYEAPGIAFQYVRHKFLKNYYLVTIPSKAKRSPNTGSLDEFARKKMCGISGIIGIGWTERQLDNMVLSQHHRGPDDSGIWVDMDAGVGLGHNRLSIIDLSISGHQPMCNQDQTLHIVFNGEIYNYLELRAELRDYPYRTQTDTEVVLAAYECWGEACLNRFIGMFAFLLWDARQNVLFAARDRFGVKPLYYAKLQGGGTAFASEIKALHACGVPREPNPMTWATYLTYGVYDHSECTFWKGINSLPPGHALRWQAGQMKIWSWYDLPDCVGPAFDERSVEKVSEEYLALLAESVRLRFRADVPVGINLSGGLDSSILLGLVHAVQGVDSRVNAYTFTTGDPDYDELPWVTQMLAATKHPHRICELQPQDVPALAERVQRQQDEPFGGLPTLAYSKVFEQARADGVFVLLDGQGMDEQWAGYEYYARALNELSSDRSLPATGPVQGSRNSSVHPECLVPDFWTLAESFIEPTPFQDDLRNKQNRDARYIKIPRALRFNDRISMLHSTELREPFLDHRLFELALRQPPDRKIRGNVHKYLLRQMIGKLLPQGVAQAPKRPLQTPQREWLRVPLKKWVTECIEAALGKYGGEWLDAGAVRHEWQSYQIGGSDNSFYIWQWVNLGLQFS